LVQEASTAIDGACGRQNVDGFGSLVYSTYQERQVSISDYNIIRLGQRPLAAVSATVVAELMAQEASTQQGGWYTGCSPNTQPDQNNSLSSIISISGRYGYTRRGRNYVAPDLGLGLNTLLAASNFGGPPTWTPIDITQTDVDVRTGEIWFPAGLMLAQYTEIDITYNAGFDPRYLPRAIKNACAMLVRNFLARGGNTSGVNSLGGVGRVSMAFSAKSIDDNIKELLKPFTSVRAM
jgi:hypothetical protein